MGAQDNRTGGTDRQMKRQNLENPSLLEVEEEEATGLRCRTQKAQDNRTGGTDGRMKRRSLENRILLEKTVEKAMMKTFLRNKTKPRTLPPRSESWARKSVVSYVACSGSRRRSWQ